jgi:polysaccharide export outer membrane protein
MKDVADSTSINNLFASDPNIQKKDVLSIAVSSIDAKATEMFNFSNQPASPVGATSPNNLTAGYMVDENGEINFPSLGKIKVEGKKKSEVEKVITDGLVNGKLLFSPVVNIRFLNFRVTVLGEVGRPGVIPVPSEQITLLEALGAAGDMTVFGRRDNVIVLRQDNNVRTIRRINLNQSDFISSEYFFLKPNDVVYVEPVKAKAASASRSQQLLPYILSGISIIAIIIVGIIK